ncbi:MAG: helix-turn-helix domain-containing protein [Victivallales bacterium]|nr:helix-turn-helix domain-containing protein [Victivallales bacterium]
MIKVLNKMFDLLEAVAVRSPSVVRTGELSELFGLNVATCSRLLRELVEHGYLTKSPNQAGYVVGPRVVTINNRVNSHSEVLEAANAVVHQWARKYEGAFLYCEHHGLNRYILSFCNGSPRLQPTVFGLAHQDLLMTATGLVLLSHADSETRQKVYENERGNRNQVAGSLEDVNRQLDDILVRGCYVEEHSYDFQFILAYPVFQNKVFLGSLGASFYQRDGSDKQKKEWQKAVHSAALELTSRISRHMDSR